MKGPPAMPITGLHLNLFNKRYRKSNPNLKPMFSNGVKAFFECMQHFFALLVQSLGEASRTQYN